MTRPGSWVRLPGESAPAHRALRVYLDQGPERSISKVGQECGKNVSLLSRWSARWSWVLRAAAWDAEQDRVYDLAAAATRRAMAVRHAKIAADMMSKLAARLDALDPAELNSRDVAQWLDVSARVERQALGGGDRLEITGRDGGPVEIAHMSDEDRRARLVELARELDHRLTTTERTKL